MAKGQKRSNREIKKPKKITKPTTPATSNSLAKDVVFVVGGNRKR